MIEKFMITFVTSGTVGDIHSVAQVALHSVHYDSVQLFVFVNSVEKISCAQDTFRAFLPLDHAVDIHVLCAQGHKALASALYARLDPEASNLLAFHLFAWETAAVADACGCPSVALAPFVPQSRPDGFDDEFKQCVAFAESVSESLRRNIEEWSWRLYLDDNASVREHLGLDPLAILEKPPLREIPLVYGCSSIFVEGERVLGPWIPTPSPSAHEHKRNLNHVFVTFGSMESLGLVTKRVYEILSLVFERVLAKHPYMEITIQADDTSDFHRHHRVSVLPGTLSNKEHVRVMATAQLVVHHGGAGTVQRCCALGTRQLVCPFLFDQFRNAALVSRLQCCQSSTLSPVLSDSSVPVPQAVEQLASLLSLLFIDTDPTHFPVVPIESDGAQRTAEWINHYFTGCQGSAEIKLQRR